VPVSARQRGLMPKIAGEPNADNRRIRCGPVLDQLPGIIVTSVVDQDEFGGALFFKMKSLRQLR
jgi:hypothetical protein